MIIDQTRPFQRHIDHFKYCSQLKLIRAGRTIRHPKGGKLDIAEALPTSAGLTPEPIFEITTGFNKGEKKANRNESANLSAAEAF